MKNATIKPDHFIDITQDVCPITYVKVRLKIEKMGESETLEVMLRGGEPAKNVPQAVTELGHQILSLDKKLLDGDERNCDLYQLLIKKTKLIG
ncbi:MAG: sulfurtransferase TusA family protein [Pseudomonadota bacterium]|nr:sulfurtransferase TusA family protein [Pseudomonadota bacterium]